MADPTMREDRDAGPDAIARCWCGGPVLVGDPGPLVCGDDIWHDPMTYPEDEDYQNGTPR